MMATHKDGEPFDDDLATRVKEAVTWVVKEQANNGVDVVNDGEYTKRSWQTYARGRLGGVEQRPLAEGEDPMYGSILNRESQLFPDFFKTARQGFGRTPANVQSGGGFAQQGVFCVGPITYIGQEEVQRDIEYFKAGLQGANVAGLPLALAPGTVEHWLRNHHYASQEELLFAVADAMHEEYKAITDAGIMLGSTIRSCPTATTCIPR